MEKRILTWTLSFIMRSRSLTSGTSTSPCESQVGSVEALARSLKVRGKAPIAIIANSTLTLL